MIRTYRHNPDLLIIYTDNNTVTKNYIEEHFEVYKEIEKTDNFNNYIYELFNKPSQEFTVISITNNTKKNLSFDDVDIVITVQAPLNEILLKLLNNQLKLNYKYIRKGPEIITMANFGNMEKYIESIQKDFNAIKKNPFILINNYNSGVIITFTNKNLSNNIALDEMYDQALYIPETKEKVLNKIKLHSIKYINLSIDRKGWNNFKIKIYDAYENYSLHYNKLLYFIDTLNLGMILDEGWGRDAGTLFKHVDVYTINLFSPYNKEIIKEVLVGLEYTSNGRRLVDYDLFVDKKKIHWDLLKTDEVYKKEAVSINARKKLLQKLSDDDQKVLEEIEEKIIEKEN